MNDQPQPESKTDRNLTDELRELGQNIVLTLKAAWDSPDRVRLQNELETGLNEMADTINEEVKAFSDSPTGQRLKSDVDEIKEKIRTGEAESKVRQELMNALRTANTELQRVAQSFRQQTGDDEKDAPE